MRRAVDGRVIGLAPVHDDDLCSRLGGQRSERTGERCGVVQHRDHDRHEWGVVHGYHRVIRKYRSNARRTARGEPGATVRVAGFPQRLGLGRVGIHDGGEIVQRRAARDGIADLTDHLAGMRRHDRAAEQASTLVMHPDESVGLVIQDGAIDLRQRHRDRLDSRPALFCILGREADVRHLRVRVGAPRNRQRAGFPPPEEQRVLNDDTRGRVGDVRELESGAHVACSVHAAVARAEPVVNHDAARSGSNAGARQVETVNVRRAAGGDEQPIAGGLLGCSIGAATELYDRVRRPAPRCA